MPCLFARLLGAMTLLACVLTAGAEPADVSDVVRLVAARLVSIDDPQGRPFAIVDKRDARLYLYEAGARLLGSTAVLLGLAPGDTAVAGIERRHPASLAPHERSTPAGRFESRPGHNDKGEAIVWIDYAASLAIHRLRPGAAHERRAARLASATPGDNRISLGCIVVPVAFYEASLDPLLGHQPGIVYVLPETRPMLAILDTLSAGFRAP